MNAIVEVCRKEFNSFFASPAAWLFLAAFLAVNLFVFFWAEAFFARNIADVKPLFQWMPILLIFLVAALTMRSWSEERRAGTLESLLTAPVSPLSMILGKFSAGLALVALALTLTLPIPVTVAMMGALDWGPVWGGYIASLFLAAAYLSIGLYMSGRTDNPIVALILTVAVSAVFYLIGSDMLTSLFGRNIGSLLALFGTGSRFDSITRGVLDLRDLLYYLSIVAIFLMLNRYSLERLCWAGNPANANHRRWGWLTLLVICNALLINVWMYPVASVRADLTDGHIYSLSDATRNDLNALQEPLLIRAYFSAKTHPLLQPLVPQLQDLLKEYQVAGGKHVRVEFIDPQTDPSLERQAAEKYNIRPVPFRMASRYESGVVNSYFNLVIAYGDQFETLGFQDLIEVKRSGGGDPEVVLKNPEYAITSAIRKVTQAWQSGGDPLAGLQTPVTFHGYISAPAKLPDALKTLRQDLQAMLTTMQQQSPGKLKLDFSDPDANGGQLAKRLKQQYGFGPQISSLLDPKPFWFYMVLEHGGESVQVPLPAELNKTNIKRAISSALQRMAPGYMKTVVLVTPPAPARPSSPYLPAARGKRYQLLRAMLTKNERVITADLKDGHVPANADLLLLLAPDKLDQKQLFAVDQFLMQGGSVVMASSPFDITISNTLSAKAHHSGLEAWLKHAGITMDKTLVMDSQGASLPIPVRRQLGGISINEIRMMPYPLFADVRGDGLNRNNPMTASLQQLTVSWPSPLHVDKQKNKGRQVIELLHTSADSWVSDNADIMPKYDIYPETGFRPGSKRGSELVAVAIKGRFDSWFKGKASPLLAQQGKDVTDQGDKAGGAVVGSVIARSSDSARLVVIGANAFARDMVVSLSSQGMGTRYTRQQELIQNAVDWSLQDQGLLGIRSRASFARTLMPMAHEDQLFWEYLNYALALFGLGLVWLRRRWMRHRTVRQCNAILEEV